MKPGETIYIVDIPTGTDYTVEEILATDSEWMVNSSSGTTGTIEEYVYSAVSFENTPKVHGNLIIGKTVTHPFGEDYVMPDKAFDITITLKGVADGTVVKVDDVDTTVLNETLELSIKHNQVIIISEIPEGTVYTVTEAEYPGFTLQNADSYTGTISNATNAEAALVNVYEPGEVSPVNVSHIGEKHLGGRDWQEGDTFTFELQYFNGVAWETVDGWTREIDENTTNHQFTFDDVIQNFSFDSIGTYQFRILEQQGDIGGVAYDILEKKFEITVVDDFSGKLIIDDVTTTTPRDGDSGVTVTEEADEYVIKTHFNNVYSVSGSTAITIDITKVIGTNNTGLEFGPDGFTFEVREGSTLIDTSTATDSAGKTSVILTFDASRVGETITYTVKEVNNGVDGVIYDTHEETFTVTIVDNLDGTIGALINGEDMDTFYATFENSYVLQATTFEISGNKTLNGRDLEDYEFTFKLYRCDDADFSNPVEVDSDQNENKVFTLTDSISVAGTYYYIVDEDVSGKPGVTDDTNKYYVVVNVVKGEGNTLTYEIVSVEKVDTEGNRTTVGADEITFVNEYAPTGSTTVTIDITKVIGTNNTGLAFGPDGFKFEVKENGSVVATSDATNTEGKTSVELSFDADRVGEVITYTVTEVNDGVDGVVYDTHTETFTVEIVDNFDGTISALIDDVDEDTYSATFTNDYVLAPAEIEISGSKTLNGRDLEDEEFIFNLYRCEDADFSNPTEVDSVKNIDGKFTLTDSISVADTYYYIVDEQVSGKPGVTDDTSKYYVTVKVDKGEGDSLGYEIVSVEKVDAEGNRTTVGADEITFVNEYKPASDTFQIFSGKDLIGRQLQDGEFTFKFYSADENFENLSELQEKTNDADGQIAFDELTFETAGTYYYVIKEVPGDDIRITYDENALCITVTVTDEGGTLYAQITQLQTKKGDEAPVTVSYYVFTNKYTPKPDDITVDITANKTVKNEGTDSIGPDGFQFVLENLTSSEVLTAVSDAEGNVAFESLTFTEDDIGKTYQYKLYEVNDGKENVEYSTTVYEFSITVTLGEDNVLVATFTQGEETVEAIEATFENIYDYDIPVDTPPEPVIPPQTGDSNMMLWIAMLFISGGIFVAMKASEKMKKANGR